MRTALLFTTSTLLCISATAALPPSHTTALGDHLLEVNAQWASQGMAPLNIERAVSFTNEAERIAMHLQLVRERLLVRVPEGLSAEQLGNRIDLLEKLELYAGNGVFPQNHVLPFRNPVFIDPHGTACAVGQLIIESGHRDLAEDINAEMSLAYILDMPASRLWVRIAAWAAEHGFTADELALIQPSYSPALPWAPLGGGTDGPVRVVKELANGDLLLAGDFTECGGVAANHVAIWNGTNYAPLGAGVQGQVNAAVEFNGELYLGGAMLDGPYDLAKWNGSSWSFSMVFSGKYPLITALHVHNGSLYAAGEASGFAGSDDFVQLLSNGVWYPVGSVFNAPVRALATHNGLLVAGGEFTTLQSGPDVAHIAELEGGEWGQHADGLDAGVRVLLDVDNTLYAGGELYANVAPTFGLARIGAGAPTWENLIPNHADYIPVGMGATWIGSLTEHDGSIYFGGEFNIFQMLTMGSNVGRWDGIDAVMPLATPELPVNGLATSSNNLVMGGDFEFWQPHVSILDLTTGIVGAERTLFSLAPNPATDVVRITMVDATGTNATITITDATGRLVNAPVERGTGNISVDVSTLPAGAYQVSVIDNTTLGTQHFVKQ